MSIRRTLLGILVYCSLALLSGGEAAAQSGVFQTGGVIPNHLSMWSANSVIMDAGNAARQPQGLQPFELGLVAPPSKLGTPQFPAAASGSGPNGENSCLYDSPLGLAGHYLCFSPNIGNNVASIDIGTVGGGTPGSLQFLVNGTAIPLVPGVAPLPPPTSTTVQGVNFAGTIAITGAANNGLGAVRLTVASTGPIYNNARYTIAGVGGVAAANGEFVLAIVDATHVDEVGALFSGTYTSGGTITAVAGVANVLWSPSPCGNSTINLPVAPVDGQATNVIDTGTCPSNTLTVSGNGKTIGGANNVIVNTPGGTNFLYSAGAGSWQITGAQGIVVGPGYTPLNAAQNLADLPSVATARTNLGLGTGNSPSFTGLALSSTSTTIPAFTSASTLVFNASNPPNGRANTWLSVPVGGAYNYLAGAALLQNVTTTGEIAMFGAARTSDTPFPNTCCAIGLSGAAVNDNTTHVQSAWPLYLTGTRLSNTGNIANEFDIFNAGADFHDVSPSLQPANGAAVVLALQAGGEPAVTQTAGADVAALLYLASNSNVSHPQYITHGIVFNFNTTLFDPAVCTANCPIIDTFQNTEIRWTASGSGDTAESWVRGTNSVLTAPNGIEMTQFGTLFKNGAGQILGQVAYIAGSNSSTNGYPILGINATSHNALVTVGTGNTGSNQGLELQGAGSGNIVFISPVTFPAGTFGAVTPTFNNAPTGCTNVFWIGPLSVTSPVETQNTYLAACHT